MKGTVAEVSNAVFSQEKYPENLKAEAATSHWFVEIIRSAGNSV